MATAFAEPLLASQVNLTGVRVAPEVLVPRLGDYLLEKGLVSAQDIDSALAFQKEKAAAGQPLLIGQALIELGLIDRPSLDETITEQILHLQLALRESNQELEKRVEERTADLQQALNKLTELNQLKSNFISNISHELRTPLTHIKGYLDLLVEESLGPLTSQQFNALAVLQKSEARLEGLIDDLIQFSLIARGEIQLKLQPENIGEIVETALQQSSAKAEIKSITLEHEIPDDLSRVIADKSKLTWVFIQLLDNAVKFTPSKGIIRVTASPKEHGCEVAVIDTGIGIPGDKIEEIFEPFHQLDGTLTRKYSGTGLGLALVKRIIEAHGSMITVRSNAGRGSCFKFFLPYSNDRLT